MKNKKIFFGIFAIILVLAVFVTISSESIYSIKLSEGKNDVVLNISEPFYVETLIKLNPDIEVVSYKEENKTIGYVNVFGGIGKNFIIESGKEYEIIVSKDINLIIPGSDLEN